MHGLRAGVGIGLWEKVGFWVKTKVIERLFKQYCRKYN